VMMDPALQPAGKGTVVEAAFGLSHIDGSHGKHAYRNAAHDHRGQPGDRSFIQATRWTSAEELSAGHEGD